MADASRDDGHEPRTDNLRDTVDRHFKFSVDHFVDFFLRMEMLVNRCAAREIVMRERHAGRVEIASMPTRQPLDNAQLADIHNRHENFSRRILAQPPASAAESSPLWN